MDAYHGCIICSASLACTKNATSASLMHLVYMLPPRSQRPPIAIGGPRELSGENFFPIANSPPESYRGTEKIPRELSGEF